MMTILITQFIKPSLLGEGCLPAAGRGGA